MLSDRILLALAAADLALLGVVAGLWLARRPAAAVCVALFSPCVSGLLKDNSLEAELSQGGVGGYLRVGLLALAGMAGLIALAGQRFSGPGPRPRLPGQFLLLGVFLAVALASSAWSMEPSYTLIRTASFLAMAGFLAGVLVWSRRPGGLDRMLGAAFAFCAAWTLANLASLLLWPARAWWWNAPGRFQGLSDHPNSMGGFCMVAYPVFLWQLGRTRGPARFGVAGLIAGCALMQLLSGSRSAMLGAAVGVLVFLFASRRLRAALVFASLAVLAGALLALSSPKSLQREYSDETAVNLTGRPDIWVASWRLFQRRPLTGYGFETQNKLLQDSEYQKLAGVRWTVVANQSTHNGFLSILLGGGLPALLLWSAVLLVPYLRCWALPPGPARAAVLAIMTMSLLINLVESLITGGSSLPAVMYWIAWALGARLVEKAGAGQFAAATWHGKERAIAC